MHELADNLQEYFCSIRLSLVILAPPAYSKVNQRAGLAQLLNK